MDQGTQCIAVLPLFPLSPCGGMPVRMGRVVETRRVDSAERGQLSSASHGSLTDRLWGGLDDRTDRNQAVSRGLRAWVGVFCLVENDPGNVEGARSQGRSPLFILSYNVHNSTLKQSRDMETQTMHKHTTTTKYKHFCMLFFYTQMSLDRGGEPHEECYNTVWTQMI